MHLYYELHLNHYQITLTTSYTNVGSPKYIVGGLVGYNLNQIAEVKNSTSSVSFDVTVLNGPSSESNKVLVYLGLLVGQNGANSNSTAKIINCKYIYAAQSILHVSQNSLIGYELGLTAVNNSYLNEVVVSSESESFKVLVQEYVIDEESREYVTFGDPITGFEWNK